MPSRNKKNEFVDSDGTVRHKAQTLYTTAAILLLIPIIAMQFTDEVNWNLFDFIIAGILLFSIGFACELVLKKVKNIFHRLLLFIMLLAVFFIVWAELAVGIF
jgi:hypothetical protein